jgi:hypothetical protein
MDSMFDDDDDQKQEQTNKLTLLNIFKYDPHFICVLFNRSKPLDDSKQSVEFQHTRAT